MQEFLRISLRDLPYSLDLTNPEVHVWQAELDLPIESIEKLARSLSADELDRANRFRFEQHRHRFVASRGILRAILASYLNAAAAQIRFAYSPQGKPTLDTSSQSALRYPTLSFNVTHSEGLALYAITLDRLIGIDIEYLPPPREVNELAKRFFLPREYDTICSFPPAQQQAVFLQIWTYKEAYLKATGEGLMGLKRVEVSFPASDTEAPATLTLHDASQSPLHWQTAQLHPHPDYVAALVVEGRDLQLVNYHFGSEE
jgi:4'-phosphopantetheinyl transferase